MINWKSLSLALLLSASCAYAENTKVKLALNWKAEPEFAGFYTAQINKTYEKNKIEAEILQGGAGTPTVQMIASGQVEFGIVSGDEITLARANGADVVGLFTVFQTAPYALMVREDSGIKDIKGLFDSNMSLAVVKGLPYIVYLEKKYGPGKVKLVPYAGGITNFLADKNYAQQCFISSEPLLAAKSGIKTKTFLVADSGFNPYTVVLATNGKTIKEKPELVKAMVDSVREGWKSYIKDPKATHELIAKLNPSMTVEGMKEMQKVEAKLIETAETKKSGLGVMTEARWTELNKQLHELGLTKKLIPAKEMFYTP
ncbi:MAG: transporter substrate-binding protein [Pseudobdellovibrio sp.]|jgi:NitT/TauT family transport system substrate-binding protein|nr:transporter substrate-binding protein [Pseudobdellovibrio sp.]